VLEGLDQAKGLINEEAADDAASVPFYGKAGRPKRNEGLINRRGGLDLLRRAVRDAGSYRVRQLWFCLQGGMSSWAHACVALCGIV
jgi:hypothetical protein